MPAAVTPSGVRDGDPAALAGLCAARGASVLAYCRHVAGDARAAEAAADAFGAFRAAVIAMPALEDLNPEALLINATRRAAASRAQHGPVGICAVVSLLLAARADKTISAADEAVLEQHLESCWACRAPVARFAAGERAYRDPPDRLMDPAVIAAMIAAMAAAADEPPAADEPAAADEWPAADEPAPADGPSPAVMNGSAHPPPPVDELPPLQADLTPPAGVDQPTTEFGAPDVLKPDPAAAQVAADDAVEPEHKILLDAAEKPAPARKRAAIGAHIPRVRRGEPTPKARPRAQAPPGGVLAGAGARRARSRGGGRQRSRPGLRLPIVLPVAVVLAAVLAALFVSGVFGGDDPASDPRVAAPADTAAQPAPADVVVVPGAKEASPDDVESAKSRDRARAQRRREAAAAREQSRTTPATTPPAGANTAPPPAAVPPPPPPPPPARAERSDGSRTVDAGNGATGAEQIPPAQDSSTVPDLAPAPEPAPAP